MQPETQDKTKLISIVAHSATREVTVWPTDAKAIKVGESVTWKLFIDTNDAGTFPPDPSRVKPLEVAFALKFSPADGFEDIEVHGCGQGRTKAVKRGVYHYEIAFALENRIFAVFGCPSTEVED